VRVFDSNILIYYLNGVFSSPRRKQIADWIRQGALVSVVSRIEVLGFAQPERERIRARTFLALFREVALEAEVVEETISVRRRHSIKVPDAIIAGTALDLDLPLVTRNTSDFEAIDGLSLLNPFED
jgi:predicted nucleic acid-binding protein